MLKLLCVLSSLVSYITKSFDEYVKHTFWNRWNNSMASGMHICYWPVTTPDGLAMAWKSSIYSTTDLNITQYCESFKHISQSQQSCDTIQLNTAPQNKVTGHIQTQHTHTHNRFTALWNLYWICSIYIYWICMLNLEHIQTMSDINDIATSRTMQTTKICTGTNDVKMKLEIAGAIFYTNINTLLDLNYAFNALTLLVWHQVEHPGCAKFDWWGVGMVICLEQGANGLHMVQLMPLPPIISCFTKSQNGSAFLVPAYPRCPGKKAIKWL